jgi:hypothetical protein
VCLHHFDKYFSSTTIDNIIADTINYCSNATIDHIIAAVPPLTFLMVIVAIPPFTILSIVVAVIDLIYWLTQALICLYVLLDSNAVFLTYLCYQK